MRASSVLVNVQAVVRRAVGPRTRTDVRRVRSPKTVGPDRVTSAPELVSVVVDGNQMLLPEGQYLGASLLSIGEHVLRMSGRRSEPRGLFCAMGVCYECLVHIDGESDQQACLARVHAGMVVRRGIAPDGPRAAS
jgi:hypothetical protein